MYGLLQYEDIMSYISGLCLLVTIILIMGWLPNKDHSATSSSQSYFGIWIWVCVRGVGDHPGWVGCEANSTQ